MVKAKKKTKKTKAAKKPKHAKKHGHAKKHKAKPAKRITKQKRSLKHVKQIKAFVTKDMTLGEVASKYPVAVPILVKYGMHCIGCYAASYETIEQGAKAHGLTDKNIQDMLDEINAAVKEDSGSIE